MKKISIAFLITLAILPLSSQAASFDCKKAKTWIENTICASPQLSSLDELLATTYQQALKSVHDPKKLKAEQKEWLKQRQQCTDEACVKQAYTERLTVLTQKVADPMPTNRSILGEYQRYYGDKPDTNTASIEISKWTEDQYHVEGSAVYILDPTIEGAVNTGELNGNFALQGNKIFYKEGEDEESCALTITFNKDSLTVSEDNSACGGHNVNFDGSYRKKK